jgi:hypothetical protein
LEIVINVNHGEGMKRLLLTVLLIPSFVFGSTIIDYLEQAIKDSNYQKVKLILPNIQISNLEKQQLLDLAQDMINYHKNEGKITNIAKPELFLSLLIYQQFLILFYVSMPFVYEIEAYSGHRYKDTLINKYILLRIWRYICSMGMGLCTGCSIGTIYNYMVTSKRNYKDSIEIKNLINKATIKEA